MAPYRVLTDIDVSNRLTMELAIDKMKDAFVEQARGTLIAPPRHQVGGPDGSLVFTIGAATDLERVIGFRVYDTFPKTSKADDQAQIVAVYEYGTGRFKGLVIGRLLGAMRTGAIGGVAMEFLSHEGASTLAVIGAGYQARTQVQAALAVRNINRVILHNRTFSKATRFAEQIQAGYDVQVEVAESAQKAVTASEIVICATRSPIPVLDAAWIRPGTYVSTIGPKSVNAHEIPNELIEVATVIATDSLAQARSYDPPFFIEDLGRVTELDQIVSGMYEAPGGDAINLFCSVGLAGTEVILANELLELAGRQAE